MKKRFLALLLTLTMVLSMGVIVASANTEPAPEGNPPAEETLPTFVAYHGSITVDGSILIKKQVESWENDIDANAHVPLGDDVYMGLAWGSGVEDIAEVDRTDKEKLAEAKSYFYVLLYTHGQNLSKVELTLAEDTFTLTKGEEATLPTDVKAAFGTTLCNMGDYYDDIGLGFKQDWQEFEAAFEMQIPLADLDVIITETEVTIPFEIKVTTDKAVVEKAANVRFSGINPFYTITMAGYQCDDFSTDGSWTLGGNPAVNTFRNFLINGWNLRVTYHKDLLTNGGVRIGCNTRNTIKYADNNFVKMQLTVNALPEGRPVAIWEDGGVDTKNPARVRIVLGVNNQGGTYPQKVTLLDLYNGGEDGLFLYRDIGEPIVEGEPLHADSTMKIGKQVGDTFDLSLHMQPDNSLTVWVDNVEIGTFPPMDDAIFTARRTAAGSNGFGWYFSVLPGANIATGATSNNLELDVTVVNTLEGVGAPLEIDAFKAVMDGVYNNYETALDPPSTNNGGELETDPVTSAPETNQTPTTEAPSNNETQAPENNTEPTDNTEKRRGCGSAIAGGALATLLSVGLAGVMLKKKH